MKSGAILLLVLIKMNVRTCGMDVERNNHTDVDFGRFGTNTADVDFGRF